MSEEENMSKEKTYTLSEATNYAISHFMGNGVSAICDLNGKVRILVKDEATKAKIPTKIKGHPTEIVVGTALITL